MSLAGKSRAPRLVVLLGLMVGLGSSCYRAEIDLSGLLDDGAPSVAGAPAAGADSGPECDPLADTSEEEACRSQRLPDRAECAAVVSGAWAGCYDGGCTVCTDKDDRVPGYPYYFKWHPCCVPNHTCGVNRTLLCNERCPAPTEHDKIPPCMTLLP